jgi:hypothetical protein
LFGIYLVSAITVYYIEQEFIVYAKIRHDFLRQVSMHLHPIGFLHILIICFVLLSQTTAHLRTVLIEGIPHKLRSPRTLRAYLNHLYPDSVRHIRVGVNIRYLQKLIADREVVVDKLEFAMYECHSTGMRPTVKVGDMSLEVDAITHYSQLLDEMNEAVKNEQERVLKAIGWKTQLERLEKATTIEEFLRVTEISSKKVAKSSKMRKSNSTLKTNSTSSGLSDQPDQQDREDWDQYQSYQSSTNLAMEYESFETSSRRRVPSEDNLDLLIAADSDRESVEEDEFVYTLTCWQYFHRIFTSSNWAECWYHFRQGRRIDEYVPIEDKAASEYDGISGDNKMNKSRKSDEDRGGPDQDDEQTGLLSSSAGPSAENRLYLSKAFVTFKSFTAATTAKQVIHMQLAGRMAITEAPEPVDMAWDNMYVTRKQTIFRRYLVEILVVFLIIVWVAPVTLMSYIFSYDALVTFFPILDTWATNSMLFESLLDLIQPLMIVALMNLLPPMLTALATFEGCIAMSVNQVRSFNRYFAFQVVNVFLVIVIAGSVIDCVTEIYESPSEAFELLGSSLPAVAGFFTNYILFKAYTGLGLELIRFPSLFSYWCKLLFTRNVTPRDIKSVPLAGALRDILNPGWFPYNKILAQDSLVFVICATYSCISPFIILAGMAYYSMAVYVYRHQMIYVYEPVYETGGKWWPILARCFVVALLFAQATMVGMFILKETYTEIYFLALLFFATLGYYWYVSSIYVPLASQLPLDMAVSMDRDPSINGQDKLHGEDDYMQPSLRAPSLKPIVEFPLESIQGRPTAV